MSANDDRPLTTVRDSGSATEAVSPPPDDRPPRHPGPATTLDRAVSRQLSEVARRHSLTPLTLALGALAAVCHRCTDRPQVLVAAAIPGAETPLTLRLPVTGEEPVTAPAVRAGELLAESLRRGVDPAADLDRPRPPAAVAPGAAPDRETAAPCLSLTTGSEGWSLHLEGADGAARTLGRVRTVLETVAQDPDRPVAELPLLTGAERRQMIEAWNDTAAPRPQAAVHELIAAQAGASPDALAVQFGDRRLTHGELDRRAGRLAAHLRGLGVGPEVLVGICVERSPDLLVGMLGILKAGGAYVPIDPGYPSARQSYMLAQSGALLLLTQESLLEGLPVSDVHVVCLDRDWPLIERLPEAPAVPASPEQLAYVIYTSGSTGDPKGVEIPHRAVVNLLLAMRVRPGLGPADVLLAVTTASFDMAGLELFLPLLVGAHLVIAPSTTAADPRLLAQALTAAEATVLQATPSTWQMLVGAGWSGRPGLKGLSGGEALSAALAADLLDRGVDLWNVYGPTETTIWSAAAHITEREAAPPIGWPIDNTTLYVLDPRLEPVPVGATGELYIGGAGLARGYRGRPDLTAERFVEHPDELSGGRRLYRTGDLARFRADGAVEFVGRVDNQVKIRGHRIELGEVELALSSHPGVRNAVVVAVRDGDAAALAGYVIPPDGTPAPTSGELRRFVGDRLPAYMVPATVTTLESFPLTPNGKLDRKALPKPAHERSDEGEYVAARSEMERRLVAIWEEILGIRPIGVTDDFFELGVSSLTAARLFGVIDKAFAGRLPLSPVFGASTVEALAKLIGAEQSRRRWTSLVPIQASGRRTPLFCIHGGAGTILLFHDLARRLGVDQPVYGLQARGLYGREPPLLTVEAMAEHYVAELRTVQPVGPYQLVGYCMGGTVALEVAQRLRGAGEQVGLLAMINCTSPSYARKYRQYFVDEDEREAPRRRSWLRRQLGARWGQVYWRARHWAFKYYVATGRGLPDSYRNDYFVWISRMAELSYDLRPYPDRVVLLRAEGLYKEPDLGWREAVTGPLEAHEIPGDHRGTGRRSMTEPKVGFVAEVLGRYLDATAPRRPTLERAELLGRRP